jgi:succinate dehydrogenase / fumarate reductase cytochrome b subunit
MILPTSTVARKIVMAITGQMMIVFVILHVIGNSTIYSDRLINAYAAALHAMPLLLWAIRSFMFAMLCFHIYLGITITLENRNAKPRPYAVTKHISATFAGKNMIWTGTLIAAFLAYHLMHFTIQIIYPQFSAVRNPDSLGRPDVFMMVTQSFHLVGVVSLYVIAVTALLLHLSHGIQSSFQTWGMNNDTTQPLMIRGGWIAALILFLGYAAIPVAIATGLLKQ